MKKTLSAVLSAAVILGFSGFATSVSASPGGPHTQAEKERLQELADYADYVALQGEMKAQLQKSYELVMGPIN